jgi:hypothetical protein
MLPTAQLHPLEESDSLSDVIGLLTRDGAGACWLRRRGAPQELAGLLQPLGVLQR